MADTFSFFFSSQKQPEYDPFGLKKGKRLQRFYFDVCEGKVVFAWKFIFHV